MRLSISHSLAVGMTAVILIGMWVLTSCRVISITKIILIAWAYLNQTSDSQITTIPRLSDAIGTRTKNLIYKNDFKHVVTAWWEGNHIPSIGDKDITKMEPL